MRCFGVLFVCLLCPSVAQAEELTLLGWSADERYFAVRTVLQIATKEQLQADKMGNMQEEGGGPSGRSIEFCSGYIDPVSKRPFSGDLTIAIYELKNIKQPHEGSAQVTLALPAFKIYEGGFHYPEDETGTHSNCTPHKKAKANLSQAKAAMNKKGIDFKKKGGTIAFVSHKKASPLRYELTGWDVIERERVNDDFDPEQPIIFEVPLKEFSDEPKMSATWIGRMNLYVPKERHTQKVIAKGIEKEVDATFPPLLLGTKPVSITYQRAFAGSGGVELMNVYTSPSGRVVVFGVSVWDFNYYTGRSNDYQFPFAYERWAS